VPRLPATEAEALRRAIDEARALDPRPFLTTAKLVDDAPATHARSRGRRAPVGLFLSKLGRDAGLPILERLAFDPPRDETASVVRRDLVEAVGLLRDTRAVPVLAAILEDETEDAETTRTAAEALARIGTDEAAAHLLTALDDARGERERAIVAGIGECRHLRVTEELARRLRSTTDDDLARAAARSLGRAGNAWAWRTLADRQEESRIRTTAARALVEAYVHHDGDVRVAASNALMVVDAPETPALIEEARRRATPAQRDALDALAMRFARNPTRLR